MTKIRKIVWFLIVIASVLPTFPGMKLVSLDLTYSDILYAAAFYLVCIDRMANKQPILTLLNKRFASTWTILACAGGGHLISLLRTTQPFTTFGIIAQYVFTFVIFLTVIDYLADKKLSNVLKILGLYLIPTIVSGVIVTLTDFGVLHVFKEQLMYGSRYKGFDGSLPTGYGAKTVLAFVVSYMFWRLSERRLHKVLSFIMICMCIHVIFLTASFGALLMLLTALFCIMWFASKKKAVMRILAFALAFFGILLFYLHQAGSSLYLEYMPGVMQQRLEANDGEFGSFELRMELNRLGIAEFLKSPMVGTGYAQYVDQNAYNIVVHNTAISAAVEAGILGLMAVLLYLLIPVRHAYRILKVADEDRERTMFLFLMIYAVCRIIQSLVGHEFVLRDEWIPGLVIFVLYANRSLNLAKKQAPANVIARAVAEPSV